MKNVKSPAVDSRELTIRTIKPELSQAAVRFFEVECRNECDGGTAPATLDSALGSLLQMSEDVLHGLNANLTAMKPDKKGLEQELREYIKLFGGDTRLEYMLEGKSFAVVDGSPKSVNPSLPRKKLRRS